MDSDKTYLDRVYDLESGEQTRGFYDEWSGSYDDEVAGQGYVTPARAAAALAEHAKDKTAPLLDIGCGTGLAGKQFHEAGFTTIDGTDFSAEMLAQARAKGVYRDLTQTDLSDPFPFEDGTYPMIAAIGVLTPGHAPASTIDEVMAKLPSGGLFVFSLNDHGLASTDYPGRINNQLDCGAAQLLFREHGEHLPGFGMESTVFVLRKA